MAPRHGAGLFAALEVTLRSSWRGDGDMLILTVYDPPRVHG